MRIPDVVGNTPLVEISTGVAFAGVRLFARLEGNDPAGSVKDRAARSMILRAEERGALGPGMRPVEPTSRNTGIALGMIAAARGYPIELVMPTSATAERVRAMRAYGARVIFTPAEGGMEAAIDHARQKVARGGYPMLEPFGNPDDWRAHYETTGPEIWRDTQGTIAHFVSAMGTTGTIMGVSRFLKGRDPRVRIVGRPPTEGSSIPGMRRCPPAYVPKIFEPERVDRIVEVDPKDAEETTRALARTESLLRGVSSGGAVRAARRVRAALAAERREGVVVCVVCDRGEHSSSSSFFEGGSADG